MKMKKYDVVALGELLIDFNLYHQSSDKSSPLFEANPGGAPCNLLAMLSKMNKKTAFVGKVGDDFFGQRLKKTIEDAKIDSSYLLLDKNANTTLAIVATDSEGDRSFSFYRNQCADMLLHEDEIDASLIQNTKIFHFGSISMTHEGIRNATKKAISIAKKSDCLISFDPNLRLPLWDSKENAKEQILYGCSVADVIKIAEEELEFISGISDIDSGITWFKEKFPQIKLIFVTCGKNGSIAFYKDLKVSKKTFKVDTINTTGAGDTFGGSCLGQLLDLDIESLTKENLENILEFSNAAASLITTKQGTINVMPSIEEVKTLISSKD